MRLWRSMNQNIPYIYMEQFCVFRDLSTSWHVLRGSIRLFQLSHRWPDLTSQFAAFLNCGCASAPPTPAIPLSLQRSTGQQLNGIVLLKDLVLPFFFRVQFKGSMTWTFAMIWADLIKKVGSSTYLIWQRTSNMGLTWLFFSLSRPSLDTQGSWTKLNRSKNEEIRAEVICHSHCYNNCAKLMVPSLFSSRLALGFCQRFFFYHCPWNFFFNTHTNEKKHWLTGRWDWKRYSSKNSQKSTASLDNLISEKNYLDRVGFFSFQHSSLQCLLC